MKYISEGNTLPVVICDWLEAIPMQDEFKKFVSFEVDLNKSNLLTNCLKLKGDFLILNIIMDINNIMIFNF